ncbi:ABC transporter permease subunit [Candidatus Micrarchaeota archaeon]|nr:ABC transporter permease subunit [Candidatus Micrarchaeota archaeon]
MNHEISAVIAIWKREIIRFFRAKSRVIGTLGFPFFFLAVLGTGLNSVMDIPGTNYLDFMTPGILAMVLMFGSVFSGVIVIMDRQFGFLKETLVAPVNRASIVIGKSLGGATTAMFQGVLMLAVASLLGANISLESMPVLLVLMMLVSSAFVSLGTAIASLMEDMHGFQLVMNFLVMPMFFLSGALFPLEHAPEILRLVSYADPLTYAVEAFRFTISGSSQLPIAASLGVICAFLGASTFAAAYTFSRIEE